MTVVEVVALIVLLGAGGFCWAVLLTNSRSSDGEELEELPDEAHADGEPSRLRAVS